MADTKAGRVLANSARTLLREEDAEKNYKKKPGEEEPDRDNKSGDGKDKKSAGSGKKSDKSDSDTKDKGKKTVTCPKCKSAISV